MPFLMNDRNQPSSAQPQAEAPVILPALPKAAAWMTNESAYRLNNGGNYKGAVPVHQQKTTTAKNPLFTGFQMHEFYAQGRADERAAIAAQTAPDAPACVCRQPLALGVVHRADGPCYLPDAAPVAQQAAEPFPGYHNEIATAIGELSAAMGCPTVYGKRPRSPLSETVRHAAATIAAAHAQQPARVPLTPDCVRALLIGAGYNRADAAARSDFINGLRHAEFAHGIVQAPTTDTTGEQQP